MKHKQALIIAIFLAILTPIMLSTKDVKGCCGGEPDPVAIYDKSGEALIRISGTSYILMSQNKVGYSDDFKIVYDITYSTECYGSIVFSIQFKYGGTEYIYYRTTQYGGIYPRFVYETMKNGKIKITEWINVTNPITRLTGTVNIIEAFNWYLTQIGEPTLTGKVLIQDDKLDMYNISDYTPDLRLKHILDNWYVVTNISIYGDTPQIMILEIYKYADTSNVVVIIVIFGTVGCSSIFIKIKTKHKKGRG